MAYRRPTGEPAALAILQQFVTNEGDAWEYTLDQVGAFYERAVAGRGSAGVWRADIATIVALAQPDAAEPAAELVESLGGYLDNARLLGERTAQLHRELASVDDPAFAPKAFTPLYQRSLYQTMRSQATDTLAMLSRRLGELPAPLQEEGREALARSARSRRGCAT